MNRPPINPDDPRWTAYVLGELNEEERAEMDRLLESSDEAIDLVEELRTATTLLRDELATQTSPSLLPEQRAAIRAAATSKSRWSWSGILFSKWAVGAAAASLVLVAVAYPTRTKRTDVQPPPITIAAVTQPLAPENATPVVVPPSSSQNVPAAAAKEVRPSAADASSAATAITATMNDKKDLSTPAGTQASAVIVTANVDAELKQPVSGVAGGGLRTEAAPAPPAPPSARPASASPARAISGIYPPPSGFLPDDVFRRRQGRTESYDRITDNGFVRASQEPLATFSIDVDTASYANVRRFLNENRLPPRDAVRIEELINYFNYDYARPTGQAPIGANMEVASAPWNSQNRLVRIGIKAREIDADRRPASNLVFLIDVSGSMNEPNKLPLVKSGLNLLVDRLTENDFVSIVVYAGNAGLVLPPTNGVKKEVIRSAIDNLQAGGSTNGGAGIQLAYSEAQSQFIRGGANRVILMTDGDFNVGVTNQGDLTRLIQDRAKSGVFLSVLGFGTGNLKDSTMEKLADMGNGHYAYIDTLNEARKVLVEEMGGTLVTVAKDVKIQVDFNPGQVEAYRLIGYENRALRPEDFNNDLKDAGDMGAGHTVTALFEIVPKGGSIPGSVDPSKYVIQADVTRAPSRSNEMLTLRVRYKLPDSDQSTRMDIPLADRGTAFGNASSDFRFAASVASFGMILRDSPYRGTATFESILDSATASRGSDRNGYREEFLSLVRKARSLR